MKTKLTFVVLCAFCSFIPAAEAQLEAVFDSVYPLSYINEQLKSGVNRRDTVLLGKAYAALARFYDHSNDRVKMFRAAYKSRDLFLAKGDSVSYFRINDYLNELELQRLVQEKTLSDVEQERQKTRFYALLGLFIVVLAISIFIIITHSLRYTAKQTIAQQREEIDRQKIKSLEQTLHTETLHAMLLGQEKERSRVSKDLHDSLGGMLATVKYKLEALESRARSLPQPEYNAICKMLDEACDEVRNISFNLSPYSIEKYGLIATTQDLINKLQGQNGVQIELQKMGVGDLPRGEFATHTYRIIQEIVTNALKHAGARHILVQISHINTELVIAIEDDGKGFDLKKTTGAGNGLKNIHFRVNYLKGTIEWYSGANKGVSVLIHLPIPASETSASVTQFVPPTPFQYYG